MINIWKNHDWQPMLLKEIPKPFDSKDYIYEIKYDGIRAIVFASPKEVKVQTRNKIDVTNTFPELQLIKNIVKDNTIFDGEIVAFKDDLPTFSKLQERNRLKNKHKILSLSKEDPVTFVCFDILYHKQKDLRNLSLLERKNILEEYPDNEVFMKDKYIQEYGKKLFKSVKELNLEGIIAKKKDSIYEINTRTDNWLKIKNFKKEIFYIGGYIDNLNSNTISLLLGEYRHNKFYFVGKVAMGKKRKLYLKIKNLKVNQKSPFTDYEGECNYIKPIYRCKIFYIERTNNNHLRQPIFKEEINK